MQNKLDPLWLKFQYSLSHLPKQFHDIIQDFSFLYTHFIF